MLLTGRAHQVAFFSDSSSFLQGSTFECSHGDDLDDLADLDLGTRSASDGEDPIKLNQEELDDLPGLISVSTCT